MTEQTDAAEVEGSYAGRSMAEIIDDYVMIRGDLTEQYARTQLLRLLAAREAAARAEALREAAKDCHDEARWCEEQEMRGKPQNAVDRVLALEKVFRERSRVIARTDGAGS